MTTTPSTMPSTLAEAGATTGAHGADAGPISRTCIAIMLALALGFALTCAVSHDPWNAYRALISGPLPIISWSPDAGLSAHRTLRLAGVLEDTVTLSLLGLAVLFGFRARQFSMGADGQFFLAALASAGTSIAMANTPMLALPAATLAAVTVGGLWGAVPGVLKARCGANEIVSTLMLNIVAVQAYRWIIGAWLHDNGVGFVATPPVPATAAFVPLWAQTHVTGFVVIVPLAALAARWLLLRTTVGYEIRIFGDSPQFARHTGVPLTRPIVLSMTLGGAFAGLAGLHVSHALLARLPVDMAPGLGFEGLVVALLARNDPKLVPGVALLYAYLKAGAQAMESASDVPREMVLVIQACIVLFAVTEHLPPLLVSHWRQWRRPS